LKDLIPIPNFDRETGDRAHDEHSTRRHQKREKLVLKDRRLLYHSNLGSRVIKKRKQEKGP